MFLKLYFQLRYLSPLSPLNIFRLLSFFQRGLFLAGTDWPAPSAFTGWQVSGLFVSVWVSSCRLFVDCAGRQRGGGVRVGVRRTADSCYRLGLSSLSSSLLLYLFTALHFTSPSALDALPSRSKSPLILTPTHSSLSSFCHLFFVLTPVTLFPCL